MQSHELPGHFSDDSLPEPERSHESEEIDSHKKLSVEDDDVPVPPIDEPTNSFDDTTSGERGGNEHQMRSSPTSAVSISSQWSQCQRCSVQKPELEARQSPEESRPLPLPKRKRSLSDLQNEEPKSAEDFDVKHNLGDTESPPSLRISMSVDGEAIVRKAGELTPPKARSAVRISMSSDGEALVRTANELSPSKSRWPNRRHRLSRLRRSNSAVTLPVSRAGLFDRGSEDKLFGRSRDSRAWELHCDTDARSALSIPFSSKNVLGGVSRGLVRSRSQRSLTARSFGEHNVLQSRPGLLNQMTGSERLGNERKLLRTVSSLGRLESDQKVTASKTLVKGPYTPGGIKYDDEELELHVGDSDKENWIPGMRTSTTTRRRAARMPGGRSVLKETGLKTRNRDQEYQGRVSSCKRTKPAGYTGSHVNPQNADVPAKVDEVSAFMSRSDTSSREEDLDCIQGLLSLSQGAWR